MTMVPCLAVPASNPIVFPTSRPSTISSMTCGRVSCGFHVFARDPLKKNNEDELMPLPPIKNIIWFPYWRLVLSNITTLSVAAEKMWTNLSWNMRQLDLIPDRFESGKLKHGGRIFQQNFSIRSYEIGANGRASIQAIMNQSQDVALDHLRNVGLSVDGFGSSPEMNRRNLILVVCKLQIAVDCYPSHGDLIQVSTWISAHGKNGYGRYFHITDRKTGKTLVRTNSLLVMMNKQTRKLSKCGEEIKKEFEPHLMDCDPIINIDRKKIPELDDTTADYVRGGLTPELNDLDINQHVNNSKYIGLILESTPPSILETHELSSFTLEYRKECRRESVLQSLTAISTDESSSFMNTGEVELNHLLRLEYGDPIVKGRTSWRLKSSNNSKNVDEILE